VAGLLLASAPTISSLAQDATPFYRGKTVGIDVYLAMERGEIQGRCGGQLTVIKPRSHNG
jgi:hypothetical protein